MPPFSHSLCETSILPPLQITDQAQIRQQNQILPKQIQSCSCLLIHATHRKHLNFIRCTSIKNSNGIPAKTQKLSSRLPLQLIIKLLTFYTLQRKRLIPFPAEKGLKLPFFNHQLFPQIRLYGTHNLRRSHAVGSSNHLPFPIPLINLCWQEEREGQKNQE